MAAPNVLKNAKNEYFSKIGISYKKKGNATLRNIRRAFFEKYIMDGQKHARMHKTDSIGPSGFQPGTKKYNSCVIKGPAIYNAVHSIINTPTDYFKV